MARGNGSAGTAVDAGELSIRPFSGADEIRDFDCGHKDLNDFLVNGEAGRYDEDGLGKTYLVFLKSELLAYFTTCLSELRWEYLCHPEHAGRFPGEAVEAYPAIKIGRLAVRKRWQGIGIGTAILRFVAGMALTLRSQHGVRLIILQAKLESIPFYERHGFMLTLETKRERRRKTNRTMFLDLNALMHTK